MMTAIGRWLSASRALTVVEALGTLMVVTAVTIAAATTTRLVAAHPDTIHRDDRQSPFDPAFLSAGSGRDLQSLLSMFDLRRDTIIRTTDSLAAGAVYLNETLKQSAADCSLFCWEQRICNVAVFEDKGGDSGTSVGGACYLFDCGPADAFACRFTPHSGYTVAVFAAPRSRHESELTSLRHTGHAHPPPPQVAKIAQVAPAATTSPPAPLTTPAAVASPGPAKTAAVAAPKTAAKATAGPRATAAASPQANAEGTPAPSASGPTGPSSAGAHCGQHQFACANGSECIAIYDVCNGIPQCSDGSDEAESLDCRARDGGQLPAARLDAVDAQLLDIVRPVLQNLQEKDVPTYRRTIGYEDSRQRGENLPFRSDTLRSAQTALDYGDAYSARKLAFLLGQQQQQQQQDTQLSGQPVGSGFASTTIGSRALQGVGLTQRGFDGTSDFPVNYYNPAYGRDKVIAPVAGDRSWLGPPADAPVSGGYSLSASGPASNAAAAANMDGVGGEAVQPAIGYASPRLASILNQRQFFAAKQQQQQQQQQYRKEQLLDLREQQEREQQLQLAKANGQASFMMRNPLVSLQPLIGTAGDAGSLSQDSLALQQVLQERPRSQSLSVSGIEAAAAAAAATGSLASRMSEAPVSEDGIAPAKPRRRRPNKFIDDPPRSAPAAPQLAGGPAIPLASSGGAANIKTSSVAGPKADVTTGDAAAGGSRNSSSDRHASDLASTATGSSVPSGDKSVASERSVVIVASPWTSSSTGLGLILGVCASALCLTAAAGCRCYSLRRRLARWRRASSSKKGLSLLTPEDDEDYLVNGMYL